MCLCPITIKSPSKYVSISGGQLFNVEIPCGECAECRVAKQRDWEFRSYYQCRQTFDRKGYVYFDTLTYSNTCLPHISEFCKEIEKGSEEDFSCFRPADFRHFLVNLRRQLDYYYRKSGFDTSKDFHYFMSSEYGTSETGTHRPHHHILFFIDNDVVSPRDLSLLVSKCWKFGMTDGYQYKDKDHVDAHIYRSDNFDIPHLLNVCQYVSKYVVKDSVFQKVIDARISFIRDRYSNQFKQRKLVNILKSNIGQHHKQSQGYGLYGIYLNDINDIFDTGMMKMPDINNVWKYAPLSGYLKRKLFYKFENREWKPNELGEKYFSKRIDDSIELQAKKMDEWINNLSLYVKDSEKAEEIKNNVYKLLNGRSWQDYATYLRLYKGRVKPREMYGIFPEPRLMKQFVLRYNKENWYKDEYKDYLMYGYGSVSDRMRFGKKFVGSKDLGRVENGVSNFSLSVNNWINNAEIFEMIHGFHGSLVDFVNKKGLVGLMQFGMLMSQDLFSYVYCINQDTYEQFNGFDDIYKIWKDSMKEYNKEKQEVYEAKMRLQRMYKDSQKRR